LAGLLIHGPLEFFLTPAHRRKRAGAGIAIFRRESAGQRQLAATAVFLALGLGRTRHFSRHDTAGRHARAARCACALDRLRLILIVSSCLRRTTTRFFLGPAAGFGFSLKAGLFFGLPTSGFFPLALA